MRRSPGTSTPGADDGSFYQVVVNDVPLNGFLDILEVIQDEGIISAILWRDY